ncbi:sigma-54-dependent transcriptional regulator [Ferrimonas futtsuensis]|uniref:sigma-54-dependent transcriptional regulator n=1 Tax=Ferrimonas futtsuensis TaxID=364764 RepID=UPI000480A762|nr:sigma-54 dependent transcriptional regulator [Ferrimonas futtsuensis]
MDRILIIDDNPAIGEALSLLLELDGHSPLCCSSPDAALEVLEQEEIALVIQDMNFSADTTSGEEGRTLFHQIQAKQPGLPIILLTAWTDLAMAVELVKAGAADYLGKPWEDQKLRLTVTNLLELSRLRRQERARQYQQANQLNQLSSFNLCGMQVHSPAMVSLLETATRVAPSDLPVLITGPNGAGKERIADILHANSPLRDQPFIKVNVGALPSELMEAELFGAEAGAYTGASKTRVGRFEAADGGTLFLDELGNLPLSGQVKLLRVLQTGEFERLGSHQTRKVRVRVISATNADLPAAIAAGTFREDLYYRLNVVQLALPPLAERPEEILPLAGHFLGEKAQLLEDAKRALLAHPWPGNVRELENAISRASLLSQDGQISAADLALQAPPPRVATSPTELDGNAITQALARHGGVIARAARALGVSRQQLYRRMEKLGMER